MFRFNAGIVPMYATLPVETKNKNMHRSDINKIIRDVKVASVISPVVHKHHLTQMDTEHALLELGVPRAANVARMTAK
jgi:hypothetical protein